ncbi:MATE family efflux transporter [Peribacillus sp. SCS-37]|uniref:MATE family efflux transporter n=1 Tax=Paraperibacillus esterisolvens TaxID=3115296 RepID=UPI0039058584
MQNDRRQKVSGILALAIPAMIESILQTIVGVADTLFVARIGLDEVTAVGIANTILAIYMAVFMAIGVGTSSIIARSIGAGDFKAAGAAAKQSAVLSVITGILAGIVTLIFAESLLKVMGASPEVLHEGALYLRIVGVPSVFISLMLIYGSILRASGDTKTPMKVGWWINIIHICLDYILIFGLFMIPGMGVAGAALATVLVRVLGTVLLYIKIKKSKTAFSLFARQTPFVKSFGPAIIKLSWPSAIERLIMRLGQLLYFGLIVRMGTETYAAHTIAGNIEAFSYMPGYGLAIAAATLVGQSMGAGRVKDAYRYGILTTFIAVLFLSFIGVLLFFLSPWFAAWFTEDRNAAGMVVTALRIDAFAQPAVAASLVLAGALQGAGDTKSPMYSTAVGMWGIRVAGVYILGILCGLGIAGIWLSIAIDLAARSIFLYFRFRKLMKPMQQAESAL